MNKVIMENKSAISMRGVAPGASIQIEVDAEGTPLNKFWRRRLKDSKIDGCIKIKAPCNETKNKECKKTNVTSEKEKEKNKIKLFTGGIKNGS